MNKNGFVARNKNKWQSGSIPFVMLTTAELYDRRLSSDEKILLMMLRWRAGANGAAFMSWQTICDEAGENSRTVFRRVKKLRDLGFLTTESRGFANTSNKVISDPTEMYPQDLMTHQTIWNFFRHDRTPEMLAHLTSADVMKKDTSSPDDDSSHPEWPELDNAHMSINDTGDSIKPSMSDTGVSTGVTLVSLEVDKEEVDKVKKEINEVSSRFAYPEIPDSGKEKIPEESPRKEVKDGRPSLTTRQASLAAPARGNIRSENSAIGPTTLDPDDERDAALARALALTPQVAARASSLTKAASEKRQARLDLEDVSGVAEEKRRLKSVSKSANQTAGSKFQDWAREEYERFFPDVKMAHWSKIEYSQFKMLMAAYDGDEPLIRKSWSFLCAEWNGLTKKLKIADGAPTIGLLLAFKNRIFALAQTQGASPTASSSNGIEKKPGEW